MPTASDALRTFALAVIYVVTAKLGLMLDAVGGFATLVWAPTGIALAALVRGGIRLWPGVAIGAFAVNLWQGAPAAVAAGIAVGNTLEAVISALALRAIGFRPALDRARDAVALIGIAGLGSSVVSATIGVASMLLGGLIAVEAAPSALRAWWLGDLVGAIVIGPLLLTWSVPAEARVSGGRTEAAGLAATTALIAALVLFDAVDGANVHSYLLLPVFAWAALRFAPRGMTITTGVVIALAIVATVSGRGPFVGGALVIGLFHLQTFMSVLAASGLVLAAAIAERERLSAENLSLYRTAREAVGVRDEFLSLAAHELRTPLTALLLQITAAEAALKALPASDASRLSRVTGYIGGAERSTRRLAALTERLLDVSRLSAGRLLLERGPCDLAVIARDVADRLRGPAETGGATITVTGDESIPGVWDGQRIDQVITNLVANAIRYGNGTPIEVDVAASQDRATVAVTDHGIGFEPDEAERLFGLFERGRDHTHDGGLGVGLYVSREIVEGHGGRISASGAPGQGARFVVDLPRVTAPPRSG